MKKIQLLVTVMALMISDYALADSSFGGTIVINEVMQSAIGGTLDELNEYPDGWIELYNTTSRAVSLNRYAIGKENDYSKCFALPDASIPAHGYQLIYCDKENRVFTLVSRREIHTNFRMTNAKEGAVYLFNQNRSLIDSMHLAPMPAPNVAYGRKTDGSDELGYMLSASPGKKNISGIAKMVLPDPLFFPDSKIVSAAPYTGYTMTVELGLPEGLPDDAVIRYTLTGREPGATSNIYSEPLEITSSTVVHAAIFAKGCVTPPSASRVYLFHGHQPDLPVISITADKADLNDPEKGIIYNNNSHDYDKFYNWRRPAVIDYFAKGEDVAELNQRCEIRIGGAYSRENAQKTFIAYADSRFGSKDWFPSQFWPVTNPDVYQSPSISIRNSGNDFNQAHIRDGVAQMLFGMNTDVDWQGFQPAIAYLNGTYYGILNIRERANEDNVWTHHDYLDDITLLENPTWGAENGLKKGDVSQYYDFSSFVQGTSHTLKEFEERMDVVEYTNFMLTNIYMCNTDFPGNNYIIWRPREDGGKWRWILKDVDRSFGEWGKSATQKYLRWVLRDPDNAIPDETGNSANSTRLLRRLMQIPEYRNLFIDRFTVYLGDFLKYDNICSVIDWAREEDRTEMKYHKKLYGGSENDWLRELDNMKSWSRKRTDEMYRQMGEYFNLDELVPLRINCGDEGFPDMDIRINDIPVSTGSFDGKIYKKRKYVVSGECLDDGYELVGWSVSMSTFAGVGPWTTRPVDFELSPNAFVDSIDMLPIISSVSDGLIEFGSVPDETIYYNTSGVSSSEPFKGVNIVRDIYPDGTSRVRKVIYDM